MWIVLLLACGWNTGTQPDPIRSEQYIAMRNATLARQRVLQQRNYTTQHRQEFEERFNQFVLALENFVEEYRRGEGNTWPADKVGAVKKAFTELQKTQAWKDPVGK